MRETFSIIGTIFGLVCLIAAVELMFYPDQFQAHANATINVLANVWHNAQTQFNR